MASVQVDGGEIEMVDCFTYLGSNLSRDEDVTLDVTSRIEKASKAFGALRGPIFNNSNLSVATKRAVYRPVVLAVLLYEYETWVLKAQDTKRLNVFHNHCVRTILGGVNRFEQWQERLTTRVLAENFGMHWTIPDIIMEQRLKWLGHVGRMNEERLLKKLMFGELRKTRPRHGTRKRWRDLVSQDLQLVDTKNIWYQRCQDRNGWFSLCQRGVEKVVTNRGKSRCAANVRFQGESFLCECRRSFR
ncbi:uncharacterized protein LOC134183789 [Corticium candelabrum]|uniref:uncharacterized protein LOC134183789 n=1 Tax=Corticium candelabrum TaxID=121492 RepID=UPI002E25E37C|nr:uncharacterized protein LOC134183789 [Corticium candelabrum]